MRKFIVLVKKEVKELLTLQVILPLVITTVLFMFIGDIMNKEQAKINQPQKVAVLNQDNGSNFSNRVIDLMKSANLQVTLFENQSLETIIEQAKKENSVVVIVIPSGFEDSVQAMTPEKITVYTIVKNFSLMGGVGYNMVSATLTQVNNVFSNAILQQQIPNYDPNALKNPLQFDDYIIVGNKQAHSNPNQVMNFVTQQTMFIPIILFFVIVFSSQMIATAIASEKENKTLETLLTTPVSRYTIVLSKMVGASLIALLSSLIYMFGFRSYLSGITGGTQATSEISEVIKQLGLAFSLQDYILLGLTLFMGVLVALSISLILGSFAEDVKSVSGLTTPVMVLVMIPYFLTMFLDINSISPILKYIVYAIPFSHLFLAAPNIFLRNYGLVIFGIFYQFVFFMIFAFIAAWIFSTDKIITMKLNFSKKKKITS